MFFTAITKSGFIIRLPEERWQHIITRHAVLVDRQSLALETITQPEKILDGNEGALMATVMKMKLSDLRFFMPALDN